MQSQTCQTQSFLEPTTKKIKIQDGQKKEQQSKMCIIIRLLISPQLRKRSIKRKLKEIAVSCSTWTVLGYFWSQLSNLQLLVLELTHGLFHRPNPPG